MATNRQRREAERRRRLRRAKREQERRARRKRLTVIAAAIVTLAVIAAVVIVVVANHGSDPAPPAADKTPAPKCGTETFPVQKVRAAKGATASFDGVTVTGAKDLGGKPGVTSKGRAVPELKVKDLLVGKGAAAGPNSCVTIQYDGVLYKSGKEFDSSWSRGKLAQFPLTGVVPGFTQGIGGNAKVPPMKVGGRRIIVVPPALGYGAQGSPPKIGPNAPLIFVVDLVKLRNS